VHALLAEPARLLALSEALRGGGREASGGSGGDRKSVV
jgi:hypothetical protein